MYRILTAVCLSISVCLLPGVATAMEKIEKVEGVLHVPKELASFDDRDVEILLLGRESRVMDKRAQVVGSLKIPNFSHHAGKETTKAFSLLPSVKIHAGMNYYVTAFILKDRERTHIGKCDHAPDATCTVLAPQTPRSIQVRFAEVP